MNEDSIIERCISGETELFSLLVEKYQKKVYNICFRYCRNRDDAWDISQDVFVSAFKNLKKFERKSKFYTWIYRIAVNHSLNFCGKIPRRKEKSLEMCLPDRIEEISDGLKNIEKEGINKIVHTLPDKFRSVIVLFYYENMSYREISEIMECSPGTVMSRLYHARIRLKNKLEKKGFKLYVIMFII